VNAALGAVSGSGPTRPALEARHSEGACPCRTSPRSARWSSAGPTRCTPPPDDGVRGIEAYRETWPPFFEWQRRGATFEIVSLEVTAGADVAFAHALLRCGTDEELRKDPDNRLRLTIGLRKEGGRWVVAHEHHSFPDKSQS
jgi:ketosteroid isomerase-like protein